MALHKKFPVDFFLSSGERARRELEETLQSLNEMKDQFPITTTLKLGKISSKPKQQKPDLPTSFPGPVEGEEEEGIPSKKSGITGQAEEDETDVAARMKRKFPQKDMCMPKDTKRMHAPKHKVPQPKRAKRAAVKLKNSL